MVIEEKFNRALSCLTVKEKKKLLKFWKSELENVAEERKKALKELIIDLKKRINKDIKKKANRNTK